MKFALATLIAALLTMAGPLTEARFASINVNLAMTVSDESHRLSEDMVRICAQETDLSMDELKKFRQNDFTNSSEATRCFTHCIYEQMGLVRDGVFVERDAIATLADVTDPNKLVQHDCMGIRGANKCETAFKIHECHHEHRMRGLPEEPRGAASAGQPPLMVKHMDGGSAKPNNNNNNYNNNNNGKNFNRNNNNNNNNNRDGNGYNQGADMADMDD